MASDGASIRWDSFPAGLNNRARPEQAPVDANGNPTSLLEGVNVSLTREGKPVRRPGRTQIESDASHSLFATDDYLFAWVGGELKAYDDTGSGLVEVATLATLGDRFVTYATDDFDVYFSNGVVQGRIDENLGLHPFWIGTPNPVTLTATASGGLASGAYEVSVTAIDADGRESGASGPVQLTLTAGQGIDVTLPAQPEGIAKWRVYVSPPDGEVLYQCAEIPANAGGYVIGVHTPGAKLETAWLDVIPPCTQLRFGHNKLYALVNNVLLWSEDYRLGLMRADSHVVIGKEATLLEPVGDAESAGCWVADHKRTYFMGGPDPMQWRQIAKYPHAAVPGTGTVVPGSLLGLETTEEVAYWFAANGVPCIGTPGGSFIPNREESLALPVNAERGASGLMLFDGIRQVLTSTFAATQNLAAASDEAEATVRRRTA